MTSYDAVILEGVERPTGSTINSIRNYMQKKGFTYILFNKQNGTLYTGVTSNLKQRIIQHKTKIFPGFTKKYDVDKLGYYEEHTSIRFAIEREKKLKRFHRQEKIRLIESMNPMWNDLFYLLS